MPARIVRVHDVAETAQAFRIWRGLRDAALTDFADDLNRRAGPDNRAGDALCACHTRRSREDDGPDPVQ
jgi:hypothetical protein